MWFLWTVEPQGVPQCNQENEEHDYYFAIIDYRDLSLGNPDVFISREEKKSGAKST